MNARFGLHFSSALLSFISVPKLFDFGSTNNLLPFRSDEHFSDVMSFQFESVRDKNF